MMLQRILITALVSYFLGNHNGAICVSAGKIGHQVECDPNALIALLRAKTADVIV